MVPLRPDAGVRWPTAAVGFAFLALSCLGCTTFQPIAGDPVPGERIRTQLAAEGQLRQAQVTGVARASLDGDLLSVEPEALVLQVPIPGIDPGLHRSTKVADTLRVLRADVTSVEMQRFSPARTSLLAGEIAVAGALGVVLAGNVSSLGDHHPGQYYPSGAMPVKGKAPPASAGAARERACDYMGFMRQKLL